MPLDRDLFRDASPRFERFRDLFEALDEVGVQGTTVELVTYGGMSAIMSHVMMAALGKAIKTLQAIQNLCVLGFGEDAALLLRANINLLINLNYIAGDDDPDERARDFEAYSHLECMKWATAAATNSARPAPHREPPCPSPELEQRAKRWRDVPISERAKRTHPVHYDVGYRLYSSFEHSDFFGLGAYVEDEDEKTVQIRSQPSDALVPLVLRHTFAVTADILECIWKCFRVDTSAAGERIRIASEKVYPPPDSRPSTATP